MMIVRTAARSLLAIASVVIAGGWCYPYALSTEHTGGSRKMSAIELVPGRSIGDLHLGTRVADLPPRAVKSTAGGALDGIQYLAPEGVIEDVWIDDLRKVRHEVRFTVVVLDRHAKLDDLKKLFGPCQVVPGVKGGTFFNCGAGVTLGTDARGAGDFIQIRLKPR